MRSQSLRIFLTDFNTNYIIIYLMPSRADSSFLRYHETGVRADQLCAAGRPDPETFLAPCHGGHSISQKATVPSGPLCFLLLAIRLNDTGVFTTMRFSVFVVTDRHKQNFTCIFQQ